MEILYTNKYIKKRIYDLFGLLFYYRNDKEKELMGVIDLAECTRIVEHKDAKAGAFCFDLCTPDRVYELAADTDAERKEWVQILGLVARNANHHRERHDQMSLSAHSEAAAVATSQDSTTMAPALDLAVFSKGGATTDDEIDADDER
eukprot:Opistho-1_new@25983